MAEITAPTPSEVSAAPAAGRTKFIVGGVLLLAAVAYLVVSNLLLNQQYFKTVDELMSDPSQYVGRQARVSGAVLGDTIVYDGHTLEFEMASIPDDIDLSSDETLAEVLHNAVNDPRASRVTVIVNNTEMPDLLQHEAQAIVTGSLGEDGVFYADELLLKCPTRYEEAVPEQAGG